MIAKVEFSIPLFPLVLSLSSTRSKTDFLWLLILFTMVEVV